MSLQMIVDAMSMQHERSVNQWVSDAEKKIAMYIRVNRLFHKGKLVPAVTLASMSVDQSVQRQGRCSTFIQQMIDYAAADGSKVEIVTIENIMTPEMLSLVQNKEFVLPDGSRHKFKFIRHGNDYELDADIETIDLCAYIRVRG